MLKIWHTTWFFLLIIYIQLLEQLHQANYNLIKETSTSSYTMNTRVFNR